MSKTLRERTWHFYDGPDDPRAKADAERAAKLRRRWKRVRSVHAAKGGRPPVYRGDWPK